MAPADGPVTIALTMGDPRGIGPEIVVKALHSPELPVGAAIVVVGALQVLRAEAQRLGQPFDLPLAERGEPLAGQAAVLDLANFPTEMLEPRKPEAVNGRASLDYVETAADMALAGEADAVVTCPINKAAISAAGSPFAGHTEMLAHLTGAGRAVMLLVAGRLRVALATTHIALREVPDKLNAADIACTITVLAEGLRRFFGVARPRIAVCGLNPHCGDGGRFGDEEARIVAPALEDARQAGVHACGPMPADTVFAQAADGRYDGVVALYHDQGMIPVKLAGLGRVVNITLGLPIIRTSVGHGTAYDIAGRGRADEASLVEAIRLAARMARTSTPGPEP